MEEEVRRDRAIEIETDDEDNEAERLFNCSHDEEDNEDTESGFTGPPSRNPSCALLDSHSLTWPQSYRQSMDMFTSVTPPSISYLSSRNSSFLTSAIRRSHLPAPESSLTKPLISTENLDKEETPLVAPSPLSTTLGSRLSFTDLPQPKQCSYSQSLLNALNSLCGIGILSTPYALKEGGWFSLLLLLMFASITCYTGVLLKRCLESSPGLQTYPDIGQAAFGVAGRICIAIVLYLELYSTCVEYLIMMSDNVSAMFPDAHMEFVGIHLDSYQLCAIASTLIILPTVWLRDLSLLSYISVGGVLMLLVVILCLFWVGVIDQVGFHMGGTAFNLAKLPVTIGLYSFCYGSHSVFPNIYSSMEEPSHFPSILVISFSFACVLYAGIAIWGFLMFGDSTKSQFTLNMPPKFAASGVAAWTVAVTPVTKYALTITPVAYGLEELLPSAKGWSYGMSILIRTILVVSTLAIALAVPYFGSLMALIGSLLVMLVSLILPCACYIKIGSGKLTNSQIAICYVIIIVGLLCSAIGTYSALTTVADKLA